MLSRRQYDDFLRFLPDFYATQTLETLPLHIVAMMPRLIAADWHSYNETNFAQRRAEALVRPSAEDFGIEDASKTFGRLLHQHPMVQHNRDSDQRALKMSDLISSARFHRLQIYDEIYRPRRVEYQMTAGFNRSAAGDVISIAFSRTRSDFNEEDRSLANLLRPHLMQAYRNAQAMTTARQQLEAHEQALEEILNTAIVAVRNLAIRNASANALRWLEIYFPDHGGVAAIDKLPDPILRWVRYWQTVSDRKRPTAEPCTSLIVESEDGRLTIRLARTKREDEVLLLLTREPPDGCPDVLRQFGLTRRESDVLLWISRAKTSREVASILSIARKTVDKHVEHIQHKLGVETRTAAASIAWRALRR
jgi:DNA-binding CsgD family transcriptional regulator